MQETIQALLPDQNVAINDWRAEMTTAKQEYAQGDKLDLTGLSVELIDESNVKQMVELKDFAAYGVTVEPANGSTLDSVGKANVGRFLS